MDAEGMRAETVINDDRVRATAELDWLATPQHDQIGSSNERFEGAFVQRNVRAPAG